MVSLRSPDKRLQLDFSLREGRRSEDRGQPAIRIAFGGHRLLSWSPLAPTPDSARWRFGRCQLRRLIAPDAPDTPLAQELRLSLRRVSSRDSALTLRLRVADQGALWLVENDPCIPWRLCLPRDARGLVAAPADDGWRRETLSTPTTPAAMSPMACLYPHGKLAALLPMRWPDGNAGWLLLAGKRPCDLPVASAVPHLLCGLPAPREPAAPLSDGPAGTAASLARFHCALPFTRAPTWPGAWPSRPGLPHAVPGMTPQHQRAFALLMGWGGEFSGPWDEMLWLRGEIGDYVLAARRRGATWWLGAITATRRVLTLPLGFLNPRNDYRATLWRDDPPSSASLFPLHADDRVTVPLHDAGGCLLHIAPVRETP